MNETLMEIVEEFGAFLKLNSADDLKPEVAEWGLMRMRDILHKLSDADRATLVAFLESRVERTSGGYTAFLRELPDTLGLRDNEQPSAWARAAPAQASFRNTGATERPET